MGRGVAIGRYVVLGLVGRGQMGEVYAAYDPELGRKVAIKVLRAPADDGAGDGEDRTLLMREAQAIARLSHPNVVVIHDVGRFRNTVFIAMEFVEGHTVTYWMHAQRRTWSEILKVFAAAGAGLAAAHEKEIVHRDFKPDNVMVREDGQIRVMDFGLARLVDQEGVRVVAEIQPFSIPPDAPDGAPEDLGQTRVIGVPRSSRSEAVGQQPWCGLSGLSRLDDSGVMAGTPAYMAPEQFQGRASDARADQFSFCVALYEALYGEGPFDGNTLWGRSHSVVEGNVREPPFDTRVPPWVRKALLRGLRVNPDERWATMKDLLTGLDENARRLAEIDAWLAAGH